MLTIPYSSLSTKTTTCFKVYDSLTTNLTSLVSTNGKDYKGTINWLSPPIYILSKKDYIYISYDLSDLVSYLGTGRNDISKYSKTKVINFLKTDANLANQALYNEIITVPPGSEISINPHGEIKFNPHSIEERYYPSLNASDIENILINELKYSFEKYKDKKIAFALSGGVDSTLLVALAKAHCLYEEIICYTAYTGKGNDLHYAKLAAKQLGVQLNIVTIPYDDDALAEQIKLSKASSTPISFTGNSIGFSKICDRAIVDGFDVIIDGTASDQIFAGTYKTHGVQWYHDALKHNMHSEAKHFKSRALKENLINEKTFNNVLGKKSCSLSAYLYFQITQGALQTWLLQHRASAKANSIHIITPFLNKEVAQYIWSPLEGFYQKGINKFVLRTILAKYVSKEIAWRVDNQGLRWRPSTFYKKNLKSIKYLIKKHSHHLSQLLSPYQVFRAIFGLESKSKIIKIYALAVLLENEQSL